MQTKNAYNFCWINIKSLNTQAERALRDELLAGFSRNYSRILLTGLPKLNLAPLVLSRGCSQIDFLKNTSKLISIPCFRPSGASHFS